MKRARWAVLATPVLAVSAGLSTNAYASTTGGQHAGAAATMAGPVARFDHQRIKWHDCATGPNDQEGQELDQAGARCAGITVPLDYAHPDGKTITIEISRLKATDTAHPAGPLILNQGGPGLPNLTSVIIAREAMGAVSSRFDLIGLDLRFTGRSTPLNCDWPAAWLPRSAGASRPSFNRMVRLSRDLAGQCAQRYGNVLGDASTADSARDMDVIRAALGAPKLNYLGYSYGSYLGAVYTQLFPRQAGRIVLDSSINPSQPGTLASRDAGAERQAALRVWAGWAARHDDQYHLGATAAGVLSTVQRIYQVSARYGLRVGSYRVDDSTVAGVLINPLSDDSTASNVQLASYVQVLNQAAIHGSARPTPDLAASLASLLTGVNSAQHSAETAILCDDASVPRAPQWYWRDIQAHRADEPLFGPMDRTITPCAFWPATPGATTAAAVRVHNSVPALVVGASGDINSIYPGQLAMHRALTASRMITLANVRTHGVYALWGSACVDNAVNAYFRTDALPTHDLVCART
jgi:pimeloyl-ACP methyl ester carboxylesterase